MIVSSAELDYFYQNLRRRPLLFDPLSGCYVWENHGLISLICCPNEQEVP